MSDQTINVGPSVVTGPALPRAERVEPEPEPVKYPDTLAEAIVLALNDLPNITRDREATIAGKDNKPGYSYKYVDLATVMDRVRPVLARYGLALIQDVGGNAKEVTIATVLLHVGGESRTTPDLTFPAGGTPQATGSAITYARRYQAMAVLGIAPDDDDGQAAAAAPYVERLPIEERGDLTISREWAEAYMRRAERSGLTLDHIKVIVEHVTKGRTDQPALVLQSEWDFLNEHTTTVVNSRRAAARPASPAPPVEAADPPSDPANNLGGDGAPVAAGEAPPAETPPIGPWGPQLPAPESAGEAPVSPPEPRTVASGTETASEPAEGPTAPEPVSRETLPPAEYDDPKDDPRFARAEEIVAEARRMDLTSIRAKLVEWRQSVQGNAATVRARYAKQRCIRELGFDPFPGQTA